VQYLGQVAAIGSNTMLASRAGILEDGLLKCTIRTLFQFSPFPSKDRNAQRAAMAACVRDPGWRRILHEDQRTSAPGRTAFQSIRRSGWSGE